MGAGRERGCSGDCCRVYSGAWAARDGWMLRSSPMSTSATNGRRLTAAAAANQNAGKGLERWSQELNPGGVESSGRTGERGEEPK